MIRGRNDGVPIVVLSSRCAKPGSSASLGAADYLTKPVRCTNCWPVVLAALRLSCRCMAELPGYFDRRIGRRFGAPSVKVARRDKLAPKGIDCLRLLVQHAGKC